jgi:hypothetical protein
MTYSVTDDDDDDDTFSRQILTLATSDFIGTVSARNMPTDGGRGGTVG